MAVPPSGHRPYRTPGPSSGAGRETGVPNARRAPRRRSIPQMLNVGGVLDLSIREVICV